MITVSLFSGCGGLDFGFEAAGSEIVLKTDFDKHSCNTLRLNSSGHSAIIESPIEEITQRDIRNVVGVSTNAVDILIGGPPCQPFSKSAYWSKGDTLRLNDPRSNTLNEYFRIVEEIRPRAFLLENVHGINYSGKEEGLRFILERIRDINRKTGTNYNPGWRILNAADFGVPQLRVRFFLVAFRNGEEFRFPAPSHVDIEFRHSTFCDNKKPYTPAWSAIGNIIPDPDEKLDVGGKWTELLPSIPEGENYLWHTEKKGGLPLFGWRTRYWSFLLKLAKNKPSWTIQAQPGSAIGPFHWNNRKLSWREMAAIQTFPNSFKIVGPRAEIQRQIGNAVPSLLAEVLARRIIDQMRGKTISTSCVLEVSKQIENIPAPESPGDVPAKFLHLIGKHSPHPGAGKGKNHHHPAKEGLRQESIFA